MYLKFCRFYQKCILPTVKRNSSPIAKLLFDANVASYDNSLVLK